jgi:hypothetical protein
MNQLGLSGNDFEMNVVSLFREKNNLLQTDQEATESFFEEDLATEELEADSSSLKSESIKVTAQQDPYSSMFVIEKQLGNLKETLQKMKFYLDELSDVLPLDKK